MPIPKINDTKRKRLKTLKFFFPSGIMKCVWQGSMNNYRGEWKGKANTSTQKHYQGPTETGDHKFIMTPVFMVL